MRQFISGSIHLSRGSPSAGAAHLGATRLFRITSNTSQMRGEASINIIDVVESPKCSGLVLC